MEATLQGQEINVCIRTNKLADGQLKSWSDSPDIHQPQSAAFEAMSFFELSRHYKSIFKPLLRDSEENVQFKYTHQGHKFSHLKRSKHPTIPRIALPKGKLCPINDLQLNINKPTEESLDTREMYAKMALLMFCPF